MKEKRSECELIESWGGVQIITKTQLAILFLGVCWIIWIVIIVCIRMLFCLNIEELVENRWSTSYIHSVTSVIIFLLNCAVDEINIICILQ